MQRYLSIDILRGAAILLMIQVHFVDNLSSRDSASTRLYDFSMLLGRVPAPLFAFVSGVSYGLWVRSQELRGRRDRDITRITLRRGLFLFVIGIVFNFCLWLPEETFNWDILTLLGTSLLFLAFARKLPPSALLLVCAAVLLISPPLRVVGDVSSYWADHAYTYDFTFRDVAFGFVANGYFPVFPWIVFPVMGFVVGDMLFRRGRRSDVARRRLTALGIGLVSLSTILRNVSAYLPVQISRHYANGFNEFPASTQHVLVMLGLAILSLVFLHRWVDQSGAAPRGRLATIIERFSVYSLSVYVLHHAVMLWPLWIYGASTGGADSTIFWRRAMSPPVAFGLALAFIVVCHFGLIVLERHKKYSLESVMRRICDGRLKEKHEGRTGQ